MEYTLIRSKRKTISIAVTENCETIVKAPLLMSEEDIEAFIKKHQRWIEKAKLRQQSKPKYTREDIEALYKKAEDMLPEKVDYYSSLMGLKPTHVSVTKAKTRFGSCSLAGRICFSVFLFAYPEEAIDYVIVHELAHLKYLNHSKDFYALIEKYLPDYNKRRKLLRD